MLIVVLSGNSVKSNWVKAELAVGLVRQIEQQCRLIPIVIDGVEPPVALQGTFQRRIVDLDDYDAEFDRLLRSIFNKPMTPPLGEPPAYVAAPPVRGLTPAEAIVFTNLAELAIETGTFLIHGSQLHPRCAHQGLSDEAVVEAIHALDAGTLVKDAMVLGSRVRHVHIRPRLVREHVARATDVNVIERRLLAAAEPHGAGSTGDR